jgi:tRNA (cmo5U34)-methyltransferase
MEQWNDAAFARQWAEQNIDNPARRHTLDLLVKIAADYLDATPVPRHILDVGCGHGEIAARMLSAIAGTTLVGIDGSPPMLDLARERLAPFGMRATLTLADFDDMTPKKLAGGPFGIAFANQSLHNAADESKSKTLASVRAVLAPGGLFLLSDRMRLATPALFPVYRSLWDEAGPEYGNQQNEGHSFAEHEASVARKGDRPGSLEQNILWLREAGFAEVAAVQVIGIRAIVAAVAR